MKEMGDTADPVFEIIASRAVVPVECPTVMVDGRRYNATYDAARNVFVATPDPRNRKARRRDAALARSGKVTP